MDDVLQQTYLVMWRKFDESYSEASFYAWATRIAYLEVLKARTRDVRKLPVLDRQVLEQIAAEEAREPDFLTDLKTLLEACLDRLAPGDRELIERRYQPAVWCAHRRPNWDGRSIRCRNLSGAFAACCGSASTRRTPRRRTGGTEALMSDAADWRPELDALLDRLIDGEFTAEDRTRLNALLRRVRNRAGIIAAT